MTDGKGLEITQSKKRRKIVESYNRKHVLKYAAHKKVPEATKYKF